MGNDSLQGTVENPGSDSNSIRGQVQEACTSGLTGIARATIVGDIGYWYFRRGAIVHATTLELTGDEAALRMLSWEHCEWERCARPWPLERSVFLSWVELFQRAGELPRATDQVEAPPPSAPPPPSTFNGAPRFTAPGAPRSTPAPPRRPLSPSQLESLAGATVEFSVIERDGSSRALRGESERISELAMFASRLCDQIGALIGVGCCVAFEAPRSGHTLLIVDNGHNTVAVTIARDGELGWIKERLRL